MNPVDVSAGYDQLADFWNSDDFDRSNGVGQHQRAIAFCDQRRRALDVGCGSNGRIIELLQQHGFTTEGVDFSPRMVELARARHPEATFHLADICSWELPRQYDLICAWDSIWHVPLAQHEAVLRKLFAGLEPGGVCIFTMGGLDEPADKVDAAMGPQMYHSTLGIPKTLQVVQESGCVCRHLEYDQHPQPHVYVIVQRGR